MSESYKATIIVAIGFFDGLSRKMLIMFNISSQEDPLSP